MLSGPARSPGQRCAGRHCNCDGSCDRREWSAHDCPLSHRLAVV